MTRIFTSDYREKGNNDYPDPFPVWKLKRVDKPTTVVNASEIPRVDERESGFNRAFRGDFGKRLAYERHRMVFKHPLSGALLQMQGTLADPGVVDGPVVPQTAPGTDDPVVNARHIKETAYFLRSDLVGICESPRYAVVQPQHGDG